jgi:hypothetical protein
MADEKVTYIVDGKRVDAFGKPVEEPKAEAKEQSGAQQEDQKQNPQGDALTAESYEKLNAKDVLEGLSSGKYSAEQVREFEGQRSEPRKTVMEALEEKKEG